MLLCIFGKYEYVIIIERSIRKYNNDEYVCGTHINKNYRNLIVIALVERDISCLNDFLTDNGISSTLVPRLAHAVT